MQFYKAYPKVNALCLQLLSDREHFAQVQAELNLPESLRRYARQVGRGL